MKTKDTQVAAIAAEFSRIWQDSSANDFCDGNQAMFDAFERVMEREPHLGSDIDEGNATEVQVDADFELIELAWAQANADWVKLFDAKAKSML